jgi:hypothetical protein
MPQRIEAAPNEAASPREIIIAVAPRFARAFKKGKARAVKP